MLVNIKKQATFRSQYKSANGARCRLSTDNTGRRSASMSAALAPQVLVGAAPAGVTLSAGSNEESVCPSVSCLVNLDFLLDLS